MTLFLTSLTFAGAGNWLESQDVDAPLPLITNASRGLADADMIVSTAQAALSDEGISTRRLDVLRDGPAALETAPAIVIAGGDPYRLLADLRASGAGRVLADARSRGIPLAGQSAGAIVCGPSLDPVRITSPFTAPDDLDLTGLGLTGHVILPHQDRPGRAARHREAALAFAARWTLTPLWDDEALVLEDDGSWTLLWNGLRTRPARPGDAGAVAGIFHEAARQAWSPFLGVERLNEADLDLVGWSRRVAMGGHRFLVAESRQGPVGFVAYRASAGPEGEMAPGEVDLLYIHPRAWGTGIGRRLLERATWNLLCEGYREAVLWTESRNERALAMYRQAGWAPDGRVDERTYLGVPIRNLRHRLDLTRYAGGA